MKLRTLSLSMLLTLVFGLSNSISFAQEVDADNADAPQASSETATPATQAAPDEVAAEDAMNDLLGSRKAAPVIEPIAEPPIEYPGRSVGASGASVDIDPAVLGIAPGEDPPPLRREGEFITTRRGRLIRSAEGGHLLFVFESDTQGAPELPMVLQACRLLEAMENTVQRRGDTTVFILSGQIHAYRGANYLLPTMMKIAGNSGNLSN